MQIKDKVVLITGASSGCGEDAARLFAAEGARVVIAARREDKLRQIASQIEATGGTCLPIAFDIADPASCQALVDQVLKTFGRVDVLFNNAGMGRLHFLDAQDLQADILPQLQVNLFGLIALTRMVLPAMIQQQSGHIINMSSVAGWIGSPLYTIYSATKFGVRGFTESLRMEARLHNIHVSGVYPGPATTEFGQHIGLNGGQRTIKVPHKLGMTSHYVASKVVGLVRRPRPNLILPIYFIPLIWFSQNFPSLASWLVARFYLAGQRAATLNQPTGE